MFFFGGVVPLFGLFKGTPQGSHQFEHPSVLTHTHTQTHFPCQEFKRAHKKAQKQEELQKTTDGYLDQKDPSRRSEVRESTHACCCGRWVNVKHAILGSWLWTTKFSPIFGSGQRNSLQSDIPSWTRPMASQILREPFALFSSWGNTP